jgi:hypothetical protein
MAALCIVEIVFDRSGEKWEQILRAVFGLNGEDVNRPKAG